MIKEIGTRLNFANEGKLPTLNKSSKSLSGGEAQRIRLATQWEATDGSIVYFR